MVPYFFDRGRLSFFGPTRGVRMIRRICLVVAMTLLSLAPGSAAAVPAMAVTTPCDPLPDTSVPDDAVINDSGSTRFLADVDGDGSRDVVTGYWRGSTDRDEAEHWLHVELASGWRTAVRIDTLDQFSVSPRSHPSGIVVIAGERFIVAAVQSTLVGADYALFSFRNCVLAPVPLTTGGYPHIWSGIGVVHSEWFTCRDDGVVMVEVFWSIDSDEQSVDSVLQGGEATLYRLDPDGFVDGGGVPLNLPRTLGDLRRELPDCSSYVGTFVDDDDSLFQSAIEWLVFEGLTVGCNPPRGDRYCPEDSLTRGEMAAFLVRALGYTDDGRGDLFVDDDDSVFEPAIDHGEHNRPTEGLQGNTRVTCPLGNLR